MPIKYGFVEQKPSGKYLRATADIVVGNKTIPKDTVVYVRIYTEGYNGMRRDRAEWSWKDGHLFTSLIFMRDLFHKHSFVEDQGNGLHVEAYRQAVNRINRKE